NTTLTAGSVHVSPIAIDDSYNTAPNTQLAVGATAQGPAVPVGAGSGLLANDTIANAAGGTDTIALTASSGATTQSGSVTINANGTFLYTPPLNFTGTDTFTYTVKNSADATLTSTATVTINVTGTKIWYVD